MNYPPSVEHRDGTVPLFRILAGSPKRRPRLDTRLDDPHPVGPRFPGSFREEAAATRAPK